MKVAIRADASLEIASGHVMRCLTLAEALRARGAEVLFLCRPHPGNLIAHIENKSFPVRVLNAPDAAAKDTLAHAHWLGAGQEEDAKQCIEALEHSVLDWLIVDHYALDTTWEAAMKPYYNRLMVIDDLGDRDHLCDLLLDQNYGSTPEKYRNRVPPYCQILAGSDYTLLRPEFREWREYSLERRQHPKLRSILISLGGVDAANVTARLTEQLSKSALPQEVRVMVVMSETAPHIDSVRQAAARSNLAIEIKTGVTNMAELMAGADLAIGAAGSTSWERCSLGLPTIQLTLAENQTIIAKALAGIGAIQALNQVADLPHILRETIPDLKQLSVRCAKIVDGHGADRVRDCILVGGFDASGVTLVSYTSLTSAQLETVLAMRNHDNIRKWMRHQQVIQWEEHLAFIEALAAKPDRLFFLAMQGTDILGTVNFTCIDYGLSSAELGIYANPFVKRAGQGNGIMRAALAYARSRLNLKRIQLEVQGENRAAIGFYQKFGFQAIPPSSPEAGFLTMEKCLTDEN